ncbi:MULTISPECIES: TfoX/Sxy family DNA transformation protein [Deefgea]|uniref:Transcriptional regulator n=1 Tax=Deefgea chitinilytica TaxID=570276 RepID=A0ABS2C9K4_9NEIS|nr:MULTISPECIES: TfoX/Sxy family DNA transformation protein [Deefgea]MBM5570173.1 transcriptional regulator [Deefgea chitinilytica]MBM9887402.1 TfoX/Sxy family DNA transformation protein [Deefgea sp. CFH1-16]
MTQLQHLKGLGPKSQAMLAKVGIVSVEQFMAADPFQIYAQLHATIPNLSLNMLYAMLGAQENIHWQVIKAERKTEILMRLDDLGLAPKK